VKRRIAAITAIILGSAALTMTGTAPAFAVGHHDAAAHYGTTRALSGEDADLSESFGPLYVSTDGIDTGGAGENNGSPGREFTLTLTGGDYHDPAGLCPSGGCAIYQFQLGNGNCLAANTVVGPAEIIQPCAGSLGVNWALLCHKSGCTDNHWYWINDHESTATDSDSDLAGDTTVDDDLSLFTPGAAPPGVYLVWNINPIALKS
jgi:hypothetical protein